MKSSCLAKDKLHLNKTGNSIFAKNVISVLKKARSSTKHDEQVNGRDFILVQRFFVRSDTGYDKFATICNGKARNMLWSSKVTDLTLQQTHKFVKFTFKFWWHRFVFCIKLESKNVHHQK